MQELPTELLGCVFAFLPTVSLASVRLVCTRWLAIADDDTAWQKRVADDFGEVPPRSKDEIITWKEFYQSLLRRISRCVVLRNMADEADKELELDVTEECSKYGTIDAVVIHETRLATKPEDRVKIFLCFKDLDGAKKAIAALAGRWYAARVIKAEYIDRTSFVTEFLPNVGKKA